MWQTRNEMLKQVHKYGPERERERVGYTDVRQVKWLIEKCLEEWPLPLKGLINYWFDYCQEDCWVLAKNVKPFFVLRYTIALVIDGSHICIYNPLSSIFPTHVTFIFFLTMNVVRGLETIWLCFLFMLRMSIAWQFKISPPFITDHCQYGLKSNH